MRLFSSVRTLLLRCGESPTYDFVLFFPVSFRAGEFDAVTASRAEGRYEKQHNETAKGEDATPLQSCCAFFTVDDHLDHEDFEAYTLQSSLSALGQKTIYFFHFFPPSTCLNWWVCRFNVVASICEYRETMMLL